MISIASIGVVSKVIDLFQLLGDRRDRRSRSAAEAKATAWRGCQAAAESNTGTHFIASFVSPAPAGFSEAGSEDYVEFEIHSANHRKACATLRKELSRNLGLARGRAGSDPAEAFRQVAGVLRPWMERVKNRFDADLEDEASLFAIDQLLRRRGGQRALAAWGWVLALGTALVALFKAAILIASFGIGLLALIKVLLFGIPWLAIAALVVFALGMIKLAHVLRRIDVGADDAAQAEAVAYEMLDRIAARSSRMRRAGPRRANSRGQGT
ncbi:MAG: hypothetical protein HY854_12920 [Burkholderiales bacterium]|nr:hypothetical protein [Burkholderiales bacterium]